jgi:hypothetical protein
LQAECLVLLIEGYMRGSFDAAVAAGVALSAGALHPLPLKPASCASASYCLLPFREAERFNGANDTHTHKGLSSAAR